MSTVKDSIVEGNKLIAEFMGVNYYKGEKLMKVYVAEKNEEAILFNCEWHPDMEHIKPREDGMRVVAWTYEPHKNWCQLMPVVEKIEKLGYDTSIIYYLGDNMTIISEGSPQGDGGKYTENLADEMADTKIESTWKAVVEFIKWHNQQFPSPNKPTT